jgi:hypothetical protein
LEETMPDPIQPPELSTRDRLITREENEALPSAIDPNAPDTARVDPKANPKPGAPSDAKAEQINYTA